MAELYTFLTQWDDGVLVHVLSYFSIIDLGTLGLVNKEFWVIVHAEHETTSMVLWERICERKKVTKLRDRCSWKRTYLEEVLWVWSATKSKIATKWDRKPEKTVDNVCTNVNLKIGPHNWDVLVERYAHELRLGISNCSHSNLDNGYITHHHVNQPRSQRKTRFTVRCFVRPTNFNLQVFKGDQLIETMRNVTYYGTLYPSTETSGEIALCYNPYAKIQ
jgi:hypothetical protein